MAYTPKDKLKSSFENAQRSNNYTPSEDSEDQDEAYEIWKHDRCKFDETDFDWKDGYPSAEASEEDIHASYDRMYENEDDEDDEDD